MAGNNWFTIVATDLFAGSFAAILIIDAATPKEPFSIGEPTLIEIIYDGGDRDAVNQPSGPKPALDCRTTDHVILWFRDDQNEEVLSTDIKNLSGSRSGVDCKLTGLIENISVNAAPDNARVLIAFRPRKLGTLDKVDVRIGSFDLKCVPEQICK